MSNRHWKERALDLGVVFAVACAAALAVIACDDDATELGNNEGQASFQFDTFGNDAFLVEY